MPFHIVAAKQEDAAQIARLHVQAFTSNVIMQAIYPSPSIWQELEKATETKILDDIEHPQTTVLAALDVDETSSASKVVGYAVWSHPVYKDTAALDPTRWKLPPGTDYNVLGPWRAETAKVADCVIGRIPRYDLAWLVVSAAYVRRGIGTRLLRWGLDLCDSQNVPAYVESTVEAADDFYVKAGFEERDRIRLGVKGMMYEEVACVYVPRHE
ncbi:acyl-CoA N-acyltransferase [Decorospora gaudefroyi]|uniref:Acyl-CoA N-acyltransferase n=1 Tax=Decorospora gaudefroyi TaxID=184978 RepID=A0A6A5K667_9PLEO|nr:acyl-CoA N-acyltransferase [Decorospora gaudefroyi]